MKLFVIEAKYITNFFLKKKKKKRIILKFTNSSKPIPWGNAPSSGGPPARPPAPSTSVAPMANNPFASAAVTATSSAYGAQMPYGQPQAGWAMQPGMSELVSQ